MPLIKHTLDGTVNIVDIAISRIKNYEPLQFGQERPYYVAYSGGKDSDVIRILCQLAGVQHELWHNHTSVDAPETVKYTRSIPGVNISYSEKISPDGSKDRLTMWKLIEKKGIPPTRIQRYCCEHLKERSGNDRFIMTGVRWSESTRRKASRGVVEVNAKKMTERIILNEDNDESRRLMESCKTKGSRIINPIVDWTDDEVWEFLNHYGCESNPLYKCGSKRIGCIGCPMNTNALEEFKAYPKYKGFYIRAFDKMIATRDERFKKKLEEGKEPNIKALPWSTGEQVFNWWVGISGAAPDANQTPLIDDDDEDDETDDID